MNTGALMSIAIGGALGSVLRALAGWALPAGRLPWATIGVNVVGSFAIGWLMTRFPASGSESFRVQNFAVIGFCGGFTTFSAFSWQTFEQMQKGQWGVAAANVTLSVLLCFGATWLGWRLAR